MSRPSAKAQQASFFQQVRHLVSGEYSGDALRTALVAILPGVAIAQSGHLDAGIAVGLGALTASMTDLPGNREDKWQSAGWSILCYFFTALLVSLCLYRPWALIALLTVLAFLFTLVSVFGQRMAMIGTTSLILAAFTIGLWPADGWAYSIHIVLGTAWYYLVSIIHTLVSPFRSLRQAMADGFRSTATLLRAKAACYDKDVPLGEAYRSISALHIRVSDQQELIRHLLLRRKRQSASPRDRENFWWIRAYGLMDLYESVTALDHDYEAIRQTLAPLGALGPIRKLIGLLADEVESLARPATDARADQLHAGTRAAVGDILRQLRRIRDAHPGEPAAILEGTLRNVRDIFYCFKRIRSATGDELLYQMLDNRVDYRPFLSLPVGGWQALRSQFRLGSAVTAFALRLATLFAIGGLVGLLLPGEQYTYWILLTVVIVARPGFGVTQRRNFQRIVGTFGGILLGLLLLHLVTDTVALLLIAAVLLYGFLLVNRPYYLISVLCITPAVIIALHVYEGDIWDILGSRVAFTIVGCALAIAGWYLIPVRQGRGLQALAGRVIDKNRAYLQAVTGRMTRQLGSYEVRLARKEAHIALAAFSDALQQLHKEPGGRRYDWPGLHSFHGLAYRINALVTGLSLSATAGDGTAPLLAGQREPRLQHVVTLMAALEAQAVFR